MIGGRKRGRRSEERSGRGRNVTFRSRIIPFANTSLSFLNAKLVLLLAGSNFCGKEERRNEGREDLGASEEEVADSRVVGFEKGKRGKRLRTGGAGGEAKTGRRGGDSLEERIGRINFER